MELGILIRQPTPLPSSADPAPPLPPLQIPRSAALDILIRQPALTYDFAVQDIAARLDALSKTFEVVRREGR